MILPDLLGTRDAAGFSEPLEDGGGDALSDLLGTGPLRAIREILRCLELRWDPGQGPRHHERVSWLSLAMAEAMGLGDLERRQLAVAAAFHDLGQVGLPEGLLQTPGRLAPDAYALVKTHPERGVQILRHLVQDEVILSAIRHHHEQFGGGGYPDGLMGDEIPLLARILAVPEVFDSMVRDRPWRQALSLERARSLIAQNRGSLFDPQVVEVFMGVDPRAMRQHFSVAGR